MLKLISGVNFFGKFFGLTLFFDFLIFLFITSRNAIVINITPAKKVKLMGIENKLNKVFDLGKLEYVSGTNGGYIFSIAVIDKTDDTKVINYCKFHVDRITQKIEEVEILIGE